MTELLRLKIKLIEGDAVSFSSDAKEEISRRLPEKKCCMLAVATAMVRFCGTVRRSLDVCSLSLLCEKAAMARVIYTLFRDTFGVLPEIQTITQNRLGRKHRYQVLISGDGATAVLKAAGMISKDGAWKLWRQPDKLKRCCARAYITGAFLAAGSVSDPSTGYHLEFVTDQESDASGIMNLLELDELQPKMIIRKERHVVYLKDSACLSKLLTIMNATGALFSMENMLIMKHMRNNVNRAVNCETANVGRSVDASVRHIENILFLSDNNYMAELPVALQEIAKLRLENPEANLQDLSDLMPELSKSGINHRLRKLDQIAQKLRKEKVDA